ncbi:hypothetical protein FB451DRAFT_1554482 [Mycena latifolia]|nr:hypothetical protein FB451DRAFT_1554482 [Mycena latifolia]
MLGLPVELVQYITKQLTHSDHTNLRAVCKHLRAAINPVFFSSIHLNAQHPRRDLLEVLALGESGWSRFASALTITDDSRIGAEEANDNVLDARLHELFGLALQSLRNIRTVRWVISQTPPNLRHPRHRRRPPVVDAPPAPIPWPRKTIAEFLGSLARLDTLELVLENAPDVGCALDALELRELKISTPYHDAPAPLAGQVSRIASQSRALSSLHLSGGGDWSELWIFLCAERIHLIDLSAAATPALLTYLTSYVGLERLALCGPSEEIEAARLVDTFFALLPRHPRSLVALACPAAFEGPWSFGAHATGAITQLCALGRLEMSVNSADVPSAVDLLLATAARLPALRILVILPATAVDTRHDGPRCGNPAMHHRAALTARIKAAVRRSAPCAASPVIVRAGFSFFELARDPETEFTMRFSALATSVAAALIGLLIANAGAEPVGLILEAPHF